jgi:hypothetical protein
MIVLSIKSPALWKGVEQVTSPWIPYNRHHHFRVLNCMLWPFSWLFFRTKPDMVMARSETEPGLVECENELP